MGLFFHEQEQKYSCRGSSYWTLANSPRNDYLVKGFFLEKGPNGFVKSIELFADAEQIYFEQMGTFQTLNLCLTVVQDYFYYSANQKFFEIRLKTREILTIFSTANFQIFCLFYKHLAKYAILNCFEKHFKIGNMIGQGATSSVYIGRHIISKEEVALKIYKKSSEPNSDATIIIQNEIQILKQLRKHELSPLIGVYETNDCVIIAMQKADAGNMIEYLKRHASNYNEKLIKNILFKVLQSLKQLHTAGFIHKDIKPDNILFNNYSINSGLFIGDFGSSIMKKDIGVVKAGRRTSSGTLGFIAPEILTSNYFDEKCDVFSVGSLFYFLLTGDSIFGRMTANQIYQFAAFDQQIQAKINQLTHLCDSSRDLALKLLKVDPSERISASEALEHCFLVEQRAQSCFVEEQNHNLEEYLVKRASKYFE